MVVNKEKILKRVSEHVKNNSITYNEFESLFSMLELKEKYEVVEIILN